MSRERIAEAADVDGQLSFELGACVVEAGEAARLTRERRRGDLRHAVAGRDQAVGLAVEQRAFAHREDVGIAGATQLVDLDAAACAHGQAARLGQVVARSNARREHQQVGLELAAIRELERAHAALRVSHDRARGHVGVHDHAELLDARAQHRAAGVIDLQGHQARCELDHVRLESQREQRIRRFQAEQTSTDHDALARVRRGLCDRREIFQRAIHEAAARIFASERRHERIRAGREDQFIVREAAPRRGANLPRTAIQRDDGVTRHDLDAERSVRVGVAQRELVRAARLEPLGEIDAIVSEFALFADHYDLVALTQAALGGSLHETMADHAVADDDELRVGAGVWSGLRAHEFSVNPQLMAAAPP